MEENKITEKTYKIIEELEKEGKVLAGINDPIFKSLFLEEENKGVLAHIISEILNLNKDYVYNNIIYKPTELPKENYFEKGKETDLIVEVEGRIINLEMNYKLTRGTKIKNGSYIRKIINNNLFKGEKYENAKLVVQINFDYINDFDKEDERVVIAFQLRDEENRYILEENYVNYHINMEKVREKYYNKEKLTKLEKIIMMLQLDNKEELKKLALKDSELIGMEKKIEDMSKDPNLVYFYDKEKTMQMVHDIDVADAFENGSKQKEIDIAKNMLNKKMELRLISEITGLSLDELENLK